MSGKKAGQFVFSQFCFFNGFIYFFYSSWFAHHQFSWIGVLVSLFSLVFMIRATIGAERVSRKTMFIEAEDFWHS